MPPKGPNKAALDKMRKQQEETKKRRDEEAAFKAVQEEEERKIREAEEESKRLADIKRQEVNDERIRLQKLGLWKTAKQKKEEEEAAYRREELLKYYQIGGGAAGSKKTNKDENVSVVDRMKQATERLKKEQEVFKSYCQEKFNSSSPQSYIELSAAEKELSDANAAFSQAEADLAKTHQDLEAQESNEVVDDWEMDDDDTGDGETAASTELKAKLFALENEIKRLQTDVIPAKQVIVTEKQQVYQKELELFEKQVTKEDQARKEQDRIERQRIEDLTAQGFGEGCNEELRAPIVVILGHVDSGKTSLMDKIRNSSVAKGEAGGITQQIGSSFVPADTVIDICDKYKQFINKDTSAGAEPVLLSIEHHQLPGLLCIDTPGHESFSMLRERGGDICDVAILIVDIQQGLQQQTIESIKILQARGTPFVIAVTKVDALYGWVKKEENHWNPIQESLKGANDIVMREFDRAYERAIAQFAQQEINVKLFWENDDPETYNNLVPVSSKTGEGIPDLMQLLVSMTVERMSKRLARSKPDPLDFRCIVLEVKNHEGYGATLDVVLANGTVREGDRIVCAGINGPIESIVKALLLPPANRDQRVQKEYTQVRSVSAAMGFKIVAPDLSRVLAGSSLYVVPHERYFEPICDKVQEDLSSVLSDLDMDRQGVFLHASSLGSLEALITLLKHEKIPIAGFDIGTVHKGSVAIAATQLSKAKPEYALILAFDVKVDPAATKESESAGVTIFAEDVIYHLHDRATEHFKKVRENARLTHKPVFPCSLKFSKEGNRNRIFHSCDPILIGVQIVKGTLHIGTPLLVYFPGKPLHLTNLGVVLTIRLGTDEVKSATKNQEVSISIGRGNLSTKPELTDKNTAAEGAVEIQFLSKMSSFDVDFLMQNFKSELTEDDTKLIDAFKKLKVV